MWVKAFFIIPCLVTCIRCVESHLDCKRQEKTRLWGHYGSRMVNSQPGCEETCKNEEDCIASTWDPHSKGGDPNSNCWLFKRGLMGVWRTNEEGFTTHACKSFQAGKAEFIYLFI